MAHKQYISKVNSISDTLTNPGLRQTKEGVRNTSNKHILAVKNGEEAIYHNSTKVTKAILHNIR